MKQLRLCIWLLGSVLILWPVWGWAASPLQDGGTIPAPLPTEPPPPLVVREIFTIPDAVVINEAFELVTNIQNMTSIAMDSLTITYRDVADDQALVALNGAKTDVLRAPGPLQGIGIAKGLRYLLFFPSLRQIEVRLDYTYTVNGQTIARTQTANVSFLVVAPTPTATVTWTPTPTFTPTPTPTATLTPTVAPPPPTQPPIIIITPSSPETGVTGGESSFAPQSPSEDFQAEADVSFGGVGSGRPAVVIEFEDVPLVVHPGAIFSMTLVVRNISTATVTAVVATWNTLVNPTVTPIGTGTSWYLNDIRPGDKQSVSGRFYVDATATDGIQTVHVTVEYRDAPQIANSEVNLLVRERPLAATPTPTPAVAGPPAPVEEPLWLRFLRALLGGPP